MQSKTGLRLIQLEAIILMTISRFVIAYKDGASYTSGGSRYSILSSLDVPEGNATFWIKPWNSEESPEAEVSILLSTLPIPANARQVVKDWKAGVEIILTNSRIRLKHPLGKDEEQFQHKKQILSDSEPTGIWINWYGGFMSIGIAGSTKPLLMQKYRAKHSIVSLYPNTFSYYGILGEGVLWNSEFSEQYCEEHISFGPEHQRIWSMKKMNTSYIVEIYVRGSRNLVIRLYQTPEAESPYFSLKLQQDGVSLTQENKNDSGVIHLKNVQNKSLLDYWQWNEFNIEILGSQLRFLSSNADRQFELLDEKHPLFATLRWFSVASEGSIARWSFFCSPEERNPIEEPLPPNCISDQRGYGYQGVEWTSAQHIPCIPWIAKDIPTGEKLEENFIDGSALKALNRCRNPSHDPDGPYCYAITSYKFDQINVQKSQCAIRRCKSSECKLAGTANDYIGNLSITRSGRQCKNWPSVNKPKVELPLEMNKNETKQEAKNITFELLPLEEVRLLKRMIDSSLIPEIFDHEFNNSLPLDSLYDARNFCRNPTREIAGAWCYTIDPKLPTDLCDIRDCDKPEEYTILVRGNGRGRRVFIIPEYRTQGLHFSLKIWEPDQPDSITFVLVGDGPVESRYILKIGELGNQKVFLYYQQENKEISLVKKKSLPHLLYLGKWTNFVLRLPRQKILLFYEETPEAIFEWTNPSKDIFSPVYYYYGTERGHTIAIAFDVESNCHIENTTTNKYSKILPISAWNTQGTIEVTKLTILLRGEGTIFIPLFLFPASSSFYAVTLSEPNHRIEFVRNKNRKVTVYHKENSIRSIFTRHSWTNITLGWKESGIEVWSNDSRVLQYVYHRPIVFYYFSVGVERSGWVTWSLDCTPADIDGPVIDGGWSEWGPWACSASCNGGRGTRRRRCDAPRPSIKGEPCIGPTITTGLCNEIRCGDITEETMNLVRRRIRTNHSALIAEENDSVIIQCDRDVVDSIKIEAPRSEFLWSHNGMRVTASKGPLRRIQLDCDININQVQLQDSGVYTLNLRRVEGSQTVLKIVTLAVIPSIARTIRIRETLKMKLYCHWTILSRIYSDLEVSWWGNEKMWKRNAIGLSYSGTSELQNELIVNKSHDGLWKCIVRQKELNFQWITNILRVKVLRPPNWRTYLMEDTATRFIFGHLPSEDYVVALIVCLCVLFLLILVSCSVFCFRLARPKTWKKLKNEE